MRQRILSSGYSLRNTFQTRLDNYSHRIRCFFAISLHQSAHYASFQGTEPSAIQDSLKRRRVEFLNAPA